jgi:hypothetical protein
MSETTIKELSQEQCVAYASGEVEPVNLHNLALYFRPALTRTDYFDAIKSEHTFQSLTESNKPNHSFRKGIYLSKVQKTDDETRFNLLRCSTNLDGPTLNFRSTDQEIIELANNLAVRHFTRPARLNHVLAQIYENTKLFGPAGDVVKERKAKIKEHADKTKDMPKNGLIAFCTFYSSDVYNHETSPTDPFDYQYKGTSVLTRLRFRLKKTVVDDSLIEQFTVVLYPNSILMIPLSTNRLYTHEILPPSLNIDNIPTRLGYVIRCSDTEAVFKHGKTFILKGGKEVELERPTWAGIVELKALYFQENTTDEVISYPDIDFSLNDGDYTEPTV